MTLTVAELVGRTLAQLGVGHAFGVVGSGNFVVTNALRHHGVPYTAARHEGGAATMADAYSRMSGRVSIVTTHQGCGLTNAMTGITEAAKSRTPMIVLTADTASSAVRSNFRIDQDALATSVGAVAERVHSAATAVADTVRAYRRAEEDRRTVVLSLPLDVQAEHAPDRTPAVIDGFPRLEAPRASTASVRALADLLVNAERIVFIAGRGARYAGPQLSELAARCGALLATSAVANGLFEGEKFALGISGGFSTPVSARLIRDATLIVGWGCALNDWTTRHGGLIADETALAQVDLDTDALGANRAIDLGVLGDVASTAVDVLAELEQRAFGRGDGYRTPEVAEMIANGSRWQQIPVDDAPATDRVDPRALTIALDSLLPRERIVSTDSGNFMGYPATHLTVPDEYGFCFTQAYQSIGLGLATAIGCALARPDRLSVLGTGDGGFLMAISELETAVRLSLPLVIIVYNDAAYGAEVHHFSSPDTEVDLGAVTFPDTDLAAIARGYGATGLTVRSTADLRGVSEWLVSSPTTPLLIDAKITSDRPAWWLAEAFEKH